MTANETRGEVSIKLESEDYVLRPSRDALRIAGEKTGLSLMQMYRSAADGTLSDDYTAVIVAECIKAWGQLSNDASEPHHRAASQVDARRVGDLIYEADGGLFVVLKRLEVMLLLACTGGCTASGEIKPGGKTAATPTGD